MKSFEPTVAGPTENSPLPRTILTRANIDLSPSDHLAPPEGLTQELHEINLVLGVIHISAHADYQWLNRDSPNIPAAKQTTNKMLLQVQKLEKLIQQQEMQDRY